MAEEATRHHPPPKLKSVTGPFSGREIFFIIPCTAAFTFWLFKVSGTISPNSVLFFMALFGASLLAGRLLQKMFFTGLVEYTDLPLRFLCGFFGVNTVLYALAWVSPFSLTFNSVILFGAIGLVSFFRRLAPVDVDGAERSCNAAETICVLVCLTAATLWSRDSLSPIVTYGDLSVFKPWLDVFYHTSQISTFSGAHGSGTIEDFRFAGQPAYFYHYAGYIMPALLTALTPMTAFQACTGFWVPAGIFFTGLAAFSLARCWWGCWGGLIGAVALLLLPDAAQLGVQNSYFGYHWLQTVAPGGMYGVALMAISWLFVFQGCRKKCFSFILLGYITAALCVLYKAQFFIANSYLLVVLPAFFMTGLTKKQRCRWFLLATTVFLATASLSQNFPRVPLLRLNGSGMKSYLKAATEIGITSPFREFLLSRAPTDTTAMQYDIAYGIGFLFLSTFGALGISWLVLSWLLRRKIEARTLLFPFIVMANYLVMALGLAIDERGVGTADELLHRPFVWAYFVTATWVGGALYYAFWKDVPPKLTSSRVCIVAGIAALLVVPFMWGSGLQSPNLGFAYSETPVPVGLVASAEYIRRNSEKTDVVLDSQYDPLFVASALSERRSFMTNQLYNAQPHKELEPRLATVALLNSLTDVPSISALAEKRRLKWYILHPQDSVSWPVEFLEKPAFQHKGYRVYRLY